jgi:hypothetical protein
MVTLSHDRLGIHAAAASEPAPPGQTSTLEHFLTPEAMLTPGIAGTVTMSIANALYSGVAAPPAWTALILSFVFGTLVLAETRKLRVRAVLYVLNSLVIFCMAWGMNSFGASRAQVAVAFEPALIASAYAQTEPSTEAVAQACSEASGRVGAMQRSGATPEQIEAELAPCRALTRGVATQPEPAFRTRSLQPQAQHDQPQGQGFFRPWRF